MDKQKEEIQIENEEKEKKKSKSKIIGFFVLFVILAAVGGTGFYLLAQGANYITTDNARVTTNLIHVTPNTPGILERFNMYQGQIVEPNYILGWTEHGEAMRSPVHGTVIHINAVQGQFVNQMDSVAIIAESGTIHVQANIYETEITEIQLGQPATVTIDVLGNKQLSGYVSHISHITQAELSGMTMFFNTGGTFTRVTHLIPIEITITDRDIDLTTMIGANAMVRIPTNFTEPAIVIENSNNNNGIATTGIVASTTSRNIYTNLGFEIDTVNVEVGDWVQEGQVLAILDTTYIEFAIAQQRATMDITRRVGQTAVADTRRVLNEAQAALDNNINPHLLQAEAALEMAQFNYEQALQDYENGTLVTNAQSMITNANSAITTATLQLESAQRNYDSLVVLYASGAAPLEQLRQAETAVAAAQTAMTMATNQYNDAHTAYNNIITNQQRGIEQLSIAYQNARDILQATQNQTRVEIDHIRSSIATAELGTSLEHMEVMLQQLERQLQDAVITAPTSGQITGSNARVGETGFGRLFTIEDTESLRITTSFREYDIANISEGGEVIITSPSTGDMVHNGVINRINPSARLDSPVTEFEAEVIVTSQNTGLRIGANTRIYIK